MQGVVTPSMPLRIGDPVPSSRPVASLVEPEFLAHDMNTITPFHGQSFFDSLPRLKLPVILAISNCASAAVAN